MSFPRYPEYKNSGVEWLGKVPMHWDIKPVKAISTCNDEVLGEATPEDLEINYVEISDVDAEHGIIGSTSMPFGSAPSRARRRVQNGDVLVSTVRTYLRAIAPIANPPETMIVSTGFAVIRPCGIDSHFLGYLFKAEFLISSMIARSVGVSYPAINASELMRLRVPAPHADEQKAIASFLDNETTKIDDLMAEQEKLIALLKEKRQAVISHVVTKGLDPTIQMKDSGVEWLGEVPSHWEISQLKHVAQDGTSITYGIVQAGPHVEGGIPYIKTSDMSGESLPLEGYSRTSSEIDQSYSRSKVFFGDLVIAIRASVGKCLPLPEELDGANLTQGTAKISPGECVERDYLLHLINSAGLQIYFDSMAKGATFKEITLDMLRRTPVLIPPLAEQRDIARYLSTELKSFQNLLQETEKAISLLKERRTALISAAVTGQIDVRGLIKDKQEQAA